MEKNKTINTLYNRLKDIVVRLKELERTIRKVEFNHKLLLSLPKEWIPTETIIEKAKDSHHS